MARGGECVASQVFFGGMIADTFALHRLMISSRLTAMNSWSTRTSAGDRSA